MIKNTPGLKVCITYTLYLFLVSIVLTSKAGPPKTHFKFKTIVIDAGHGGKDPGAHGSHSSEKNVALAIAKKVQRLIEKDMSDVSVIMTRSTDKFVELNKRSEIANKNNANL